jgi:asparagine synthase (glutamine-hydrolysing)
MCGISAIYRFTQVTEEDKLKLVQMNKEMHYRGPDGEGYWNDEACAMAHTRLSIIGLDNGSQPLFNEDKTVVLICNGEIYNYTDLKRNLLAKGHRFSTDSDSETIIHLYEDHDMNCLQYLRGMFAFCLYDKKKKRLFVARDRVGEKVLYYSQLPTGIVFSTELKAILKYYVEKPQINIHALAESIRYNYPIELQQTFVEQIKRLCAGEFALVDEKGLELHDYWQLRHQPVFKGTKEEAKKEVLRLMRESVFNCLQSDVPVAVLLSGGIDSSAIAAFAKETGKEIHVITAGYKGRFSQDEREVAKRFAKEKDLMYHEVELDANDFKRLFGDYMQYMDEPVCDVSAMSQYALYKKAKELGFTVLLSGIGGDELFYGYPWQNQLAKSLQLRKQHLDLFPWKGKKKAFAKYMVKNWRNVLFAGYPTVKLDDAVPVFWTYEDYHKFAQDAMVGWGEDDFSFRNVDVHYSFPIDADIDVVYDYMFTRFMRNLCLYLSDRLGMANSTEIRSPLVDYKLVEFVASLPKEMKYDGNPKGFYKECLREIVPNYILDARKRGFEPPWGFVHEMNARYSYKLMRSSHVFYNSMLADTLLSNLIDN